MHGALRGRSSNTYDGICCGLRNTDTKLCALVLMGVIESGQKKLLTVVDGMRESTLSWREELLTFYDFPPDHLQSLSTTNPTESIFATIRHRAKRSRRCLNRDGMLYMKFMLGICAEGNGRRMGGFNCLAKVVEGLPTICQQLLRGYNPAIKFQLNAMRRVHVLGNLDQKSVGL